MTKTSIAEIRAALPSDPVDAAEQVGQIKRQRTFSAFGVLHRAQTEGGRELRGDPGSRLLASEQRSYNALINEAKQLQKLETELWSTAERAVREAIANARGTIKQLETPNE